MELKLLEYRLKEKAKEEKVWKEQNTCEYSVLDKKPGGAKK